MPQGVGVRLPEWPLQAPCSEKVSLGVIFLQINFQRETLEQIGNRLDKRTDFQPKQPEGPLCGQFAGPEGPPAREPDFDRWCEKHCHRASKRYPMHGYFHLPESLGDIEPSPS